MINKQRVRRIKNLIYAFIILVLFLPLILMSILSFRMIGLAEKMSDKLDELKATVTQQIAPSTPSDSGDSGYVIEPEDQATNNESAVPSQMEELNPENTADKTPSTSGLLSEVSGTSPSEPTSDEKNADAATGLNDGTFPLIGDTSDINSNSSDILNPAPSPIAGGNTAGATGGESGNNPQTGSDGVIHEGRNGNPITGR